MTGRGSWWGCVHYDSIVVAIAHYDVKTDTNVIVSLQSDIGKIGILGCDPKMPSNSQEENKICIVLSCLFFILYGIFRCIFTVIVKKW